MEDALQPIGEARGGRPRGKDDRGEGDAKSENVGEIMPGVCDQRDGAGNDPVDEFEYDDEDVQRDSDDETRAEVCRPGVGMGMDVGVRAVARCMRLMFGVFV